MLGNNDTGQLGSGAPSYSRTPLAVSGLVGVTAISTGERHACALLAGGTIKCWGFNSDGQLGNGTTSDSPTPVAVSGLSGVMSIGAWDRHSCALFANGSGACWGANGHGQLGNGATNDSTTPIPISGLVGASVFAQGGSGDHTCVLFPGGAVDCWGEGFYGQLGDGLTSDALSPVPAVSGFSLIGVLAITAGQFHTCALLPGGSFSCWGRNYFGELGNGTTIDTATPLATAL